jgi:hypothetical protein
MSVDPWAGLHVAGLCVGAGNVGGQETAPSAIRRTVVALQPHQPLDHPSLAVPRGKSVQITHKNVGYLQARRRCCFKEAAV